MLSWGLVIAIVLIALFIILFLTLGEGLLKEAAQAVGTDAEGYSVLPDSSNALFGRAKGKPSYVPDNENFISLKRGFDINLLGEAVREDNAIAAVRTKTYAIKPKDFMGMTPIPKLVVEIGSHVKAGDTLFFDKEHPETMYAAPISGKVIAVNRGEKRSIDEVVLEADQETIQYREYIVPSLNSARSELLSFLADSGVFPFIRQRPYNTVANPQRLPKSIFVSTFDTAPLAPNLNFSVEADRDAVAFQKGLEVLTKLTDGLVHLALDGRPDHQPADAFAKVAVPRVIKHWFSGQHPAGNVGIHIHHIDPINAGDVVWHLDVQGVIVLGKLFTEGIFDTERIVAITGAEVENPRYVRVHQGANLSDLGISEKDGKVRVVSGDALTGKKVSATSFLGFFDDQITTIAEGNYYELLGWLVPQKGHPTMSKTFPGAFFPDAKYEADTNTNGEHRAFVMSGQYESVLPMDILPQFLFRAIMCNDFEQMEGLGILELNEEDVALCEYVCTSKQSLQVLLRKGLDAMRAQES